MKWVERMRQMALENGSGDGGRPREEAVEKPRPVAAMYPSLYDKMVNYDLVLSVEHCWDCTHHTSLRRVSALTYHGCMYVLVGRVRN